MADILQDQQLTPMQAALQPNPIQMGYTANGPAAAPYVNQMTQDWQEAQARSNRNSDLSAMDAFNTYQQNLANNPVRESQRNLMQSNLAMQQSTLYGPDQLAAQGLSADTKSKIEQNLANADVADLTRYQTRAQYAVAAKETMDRAEQSPEGIARVWPEVRQGLIDKGLKNIPEDYNKAKSVIDGAARVGIFTSAHIQKLQEIQTSTEGQAKIAGIQVSPQYSRIALERELGTNTVPYQEAQAYQHLTQAGGDWTKLPQGDVQILMDRQAMSYAAATKNPVVQQALLYENKAQLEYQKHPTAENKQIWMQALARTNSIMGRTSSAPPPSTNPAQPTANATPDLNTREGRMAAGYKENPDGSWTRK